MYVLDSGRNFIYKTLSHFQDKDPVCEDACRRDSQAAHPNHPLQSET
jgi:hypothetical protein